MNRFFKLFITFTVCSICFYFLIAGFFGPSGFFYNKSLEKLIDVLSMEQDKLSTELSSLESYKNLLNTEDGIRDSAIKLGYIVKGDSFIVFEDGQLQDSVSISQDQIDFKLYRYMSKSLCLVSALGLSLIFVMLKLLSIYRNDSEKGTKIIEVNQNNDDLIGQDYDNQEDGQHDD